MGLPHIKITYISLKKAIQQIISFCQTIKKTLANRAIFNAVQMIKEVLSSATKTELGDL